MPNEFVKVLEVEWNASLDSFRSTISSLAPVKALTKRKLVSDIARLFDVLGWCSPTIIKPKIMLQRLWEDKAGWDEPVSHLIHETWEKLFLQSRRRHRYGAARIFRRVGISLRSCSVPKIHG